VIEAEGRDAACGSVHESPTGGAGRETSLLFSIRRLI
jgi:hypothetical protein